MMTDDEAAKRINEVSGDPEGGHIEADRILCQLLLDLGYPETVKAFDALGKWYA